MFKNKIPKPIVLAVLDGWGIAPHYSGNAITQAKTPVFDKMVASYPAMTLRASGEAVGLPWGESGNSEVGHMNLGLGRVIYQDLPRINRSISDGSFYKNKILAEVMEHVKKNDSALHFMGLVSNGGVHSSIDHLLALLAAAKEKNIQNVYIHAILDGRDTTYNSGIIFIQTLIKHIKEYKIGKIATISGRFYTMDRNNYWDRISKAYYAMTMGEGNKSEDPIKAIEESYGKKIYDEEFVPTVIEEKGEPIGLIKEKDAVVFFNYRADRARQITKAFVLPGFEKIKNKKYLENLYFACFTEYEEDLPVKVFFPPEKIENTLGSVISRAGFKQLRIAETEKYAHVTYFFNGGLEEKSEGEDHILVPSPQVESYDMKPEMSAFQVTEKIVNAIEENKYDFILVNYANADMVGHTANIKAAIKAVEAVDECLESLLKIILEKDGILIITADHGNAENMFNMQTGLKDKEHTSNPVPFIIAGNELEGKTIGFHEAPDNDLSLAQPQGILSDIASTILSIMKIKTPPEMTGRNLFY